jgi:hypothetical protein
MKKYLVLLFIILGASAHGQTLKQIITSKIPPSNGDNIDWTNWEIKLDKSRKKDLLKKIVVEDEYSRSYIVIDYDDYIEKFHIVDFNLDGLPDIIFYGTTPGLGDVFSDFFINRGDKLERIFTSVGSILSISPYNGYMPLALTVYSAYGDGIAAHLYSITPTISNNNGFSYQIQADIAINTFLKKPKEFLAKPIGFKTINEKYTLRTSPELNGSELGVYPKNSTGIAIAESTDSTGRIWWLVIMSGEQPHIKKSSIIYSGYHNIENYKILGWMSSRFTEITE